MLLDLYTLIEYHCITCNDWVVRSDAEDHFHSHRMRRVPRQHPPGSRTTITMERDRTGYDAEIVYVFALASGQTGLGDPLWRWDQRWNPPKEFAMRTW